jgi:hypothetical protein
MSLISPIATDTPKEILDIFTKINYSKLNEKTIADLKKKLYDYAKKLPQKKGTIQAKEINASIPSWITNCINRIDYKAISSITMNLIVGYLENYTQKYR